MMAAHDYHFVTHWRVAGTVQEVSAVIEDLHALPRWWPAVYLMVRQLAPGGPHGLGREVELHTRGWLPYTLRWRARVIADRSPFGFTLQATGDLEGQGTWRFDQDGADVVITFDWKLRAEKPLIRGLSFLLKPLFEANHRWAMARGEESLRLELARRTAISDRDRHALPQPPHATSNTAFAVTAGGLLLAAVALRQWVRRARPPL